MLALNPLNSRTREIVLGVGSIFTAFGVVAMMAFGPWLYSKLGLLVLSVPIVGVSTALISLFYVYRNQHLGVYGLLWVLSIGLFWFLLLPFFWYFKVRGTSNACAT